MFAQSFIVPKDGVGTNIYGESFHDNIANIYRYFLCVAGAILFALLNFFKDFFFVTVDLKCSANFGCTAK